MTQTFLSGFYQNRAKGPWPKAVGEWRAFEARKRLCQFRESKFMAQRGYTLTEVLVTVMIIGILATMALPQYGKTVELSHWRTARDILLVIYSGEQLYFSVNNNTYRDADGSPPPGTWGDIYMDDPNIAGNPVTYSTTAPGATFSATAAYGSTGKFMTIDQSRTIDTTNWPQP